MHPCLLRTGKVSVIFLEVVHEGALLLAADQPPFCVSGLCK